MTIRERLEILKNDNFIVEHKALGKEELTEFDWIRIYKSKHHGCIDEMIYALSIEEIIDMPEEISNLEYDKEECWMIGGILSLDLVINICDT